MSYMKHQTPVAHKMGRSYNEDNKVEDLSPRDANPRTRNDIAYFNATKISSSLFSHHTEHHLELWILYTELFCNTQFCIHNFRSFLINGDLGIEEMLII